MTDVMTLILLNIFAALPSSATRFEEKLPVYGVVKPTSMTTILAINHGIVSKIPSSIGFDVGEGAVTIEVLEKETVRNYRTAISGKVSKMHVSVGAAVTPGMPMVTVIDGRKKEIELSLSPQEAIKVKVGFPLELRDSGQVLGQISRLSPLVDPDTGAVLAFVKTTRSIPNYIGDIIPLNLVLRRIDDCKIVTLNQVSEHQNEFAVEAISGDQACLKRRPASVK